MGLRPAQTCCHNSPFPLLPPCSPPSLHCPPQKVGGRPLGTSPLPSKGTGAATGYFPCPPTEGSGAATGYLPALHRRCGGGHWVPPPPPHRRCGGGKDIAGVVETYNRNKDKGGQTRPARGREEEDGGREGREGRREGGREDGGEGREGGKGRMQGGSNGKGNCDSKFVLVAAPFANPKGQRCVPWGL